jgi:hypothetical protein
VIPSPDWPDEDADPFRRLLSERSRQASAAGDMHAAQGLSFAAGLISYAEGHEMFIPPQRARSLALARAARFEEEAGLYANAGDLVREAEALHAAQAIRDGVDEAGRA